MGEGGVADDSSGAYPVSRTEGVAERAAGRPGETYCLSFGLFRVKTEDWRFGLAPLGHRYLGNNI